MFMEFGGSEKCRWIYASDYGVWYSMGFLLGLIRLFDRYISLNLPRMGFIYISIAGLGDTGEVN